MKEKLANVDPREITKFEQLAHKWWDYESEFKPLHDINPLRLEYIRSYCALDGKQVLDVGCGGGILTEALARLGAKVTGIDLGSTPLSVARLHALENGLEIDYQQISVEQFAEKKAEFFDIVISLEMLEHVPKPSSVIASCSQLLKPDGKAFFSTINRTPKAYLFGIIGAEYTLRLLPKGTHDYRRFIRPSELESWCRASNLTINNLTGLHYNPITRRYWLGNDINVNYLSYGTKII
ncbi:ubiquinone biosynthesis O-methyltransferase [Candidatus Nitrosoglobus terrae]|uniref:Ubiquinone biosynthesis O-methyltransferase n=1 Tax=Candidatus Nitrosoglobus terrae TaxID=1630141 RepID=A0A1Q2SLN6_9GAMM|nr:bifunctional 2-polyprenyl-6-hydroxyphenol methylase/3-demethylubiquinol 3-O-methyltransferase UbiG [Candidatus Nitrosoglobus terrae]BAW80055.1 ubiquinone biosynthesis O-methyltransferase [Candidatus Nitrosoglobus terrae]